MSYAPFSGFPQTQGERASPYRAPWMGSSCSSFFSRPQVCPALVTGVRTAALDHFPSASPPYPMALQSLAQKPTGKADLWPRFTSLSQSLTRNSSCD